MGHTAFGLADEYEYFAGCGVDTDRNRHPATEPAEPNVTINSNRSTIKWHDLIAASTAVPTTSNADCTKCDPQGNPVSATTVGAFEGAHYYHCGAYRPQFTCRMRALNNPYCAVCQRVIRQRLTPFLPQVPASVADPSAYAFVAQSKNVVEQHNLFRTGDGHVHALWFNFATGLAPRGPHGDSGRHPGGGGRPGSAMPSSHETNERGRAAQPVPDRLTGTSTRCGSTSRPGWHHEDRTAIVAGTPPAVGTRFGLRLRRTRPTNVVEQHNLFRTG